MSIRKVATQHYVVTVELGRDPITGTRRREEHTVHGPLDKAKALDRKLQTAVDNGEYVVRSSATVGDVCRAWLDTKAMEITTAGRSPRTVERYGSLLKSAIDTFGALPVQQLTREHIQRFYLESGKRVSATTVHHRHVALQQALEYAVETHMIPRNPAHKAKAPKPNDHEPRRLTDEEVTSLVAAVSGTSLDVPVRLALATGMRLGEILALHWSDVSLDEGHVAVNWTVLELAAKGSQVTIKKPKSKAGKRIIGIGRGTVAFLREHRRAQTAHRLEVGPGWADNDLVVCNDCGELVRPSTVSRHFGHLVNPPAPKATKRNPNPAPRTGPLAIPCRFHDLRDTFATESIRAGHPIKDVSALLGHAKASFTMDVYVARSVEEDRGIADAADERLYGRAESL